MDSTSGIASIPRMYLFKMKFEGYKYSDKKCEISSMKSSDIKIYRDI